MSKLYNTYLELKKQNSQTIYLFKSGIFFLALDKDAHILSSTFHFKLVNLTDTIVKCGFPCSSIDKYSNLFKVHNLTIKIIEPDNNIMYNLADYTQSQSMIKLLDCINYVDVDNLSITEAYQWIKDLKNKFKEIQY